MKALVTGCAGFIGSHVADSCLGFGMEVVGVDDLSGGFESNVHRSVNFVRGDLRNEKFVESLWERGPFDYVYHLAAYAAENRSHHLRAFNYDTNLLASVHLINMSLLNRVKCFVFTSSIAVYGYNQTPMTEDMVPSPCDPYGIAKYAVELDLRAARSMFGMNFIVFRPHNVYGERQNINDEHRNVVGIFMRQLMRGEPMTVFGDGSQTRAFTYVGDVAPVIAQSPIFPDAHNRVFNLGSDEVCSVLELANFVAAAMGKDCSVKHLTYRKEVEHAFSDHSSITKVLGKRPAIPLWEGLQRMAKWATSVS